MTTYKRKNGKWYCRFQVDGERHHYLCSGANTQKEAEKLENQYKYKIQQQINGVIARDEKLIPLKTLKKLYLVYSSTNNRSYNNNKYTLAVIMNYFNENTYAQNIQPKDVEKFKEFLRTERNLKNASINRYLEIMSKIFNLGIDNGLIKFNPITKVKKLLEDNHKIRFLTIDEEERLYKNLPLFLIPIVTIALQTGMRKSEILNLKWSNIDLDYGFIELLKTKSGKARKIPISNKVREILTSLEMVGEYVFVNSDTGLPYIDIKKSFKKAIEQANINDFRFHDLRHTVATRMVEKGIDLLVVKEILGHSNINTTMRYAHAVPKRKLEAIEVLNSYS